MSQIWKNNIDEQALNNLHKNTLAEHLGIVVTEIGDDYIKMSMPVDSRTVQPMGLLHGGASAALAESAGSVASYLCIEDIESNRPVGIEINASHIKSVKSGYVHSVTKPIKLGRRLHFWRTEKLCRHTKRKRAIQ